VASAAPPQPRRLSPPLRKLVLTVHVVSSVGLLGLSLAMLVLGISAAAADAAVSAGLYEAIDAVSGTVVPPFALSALVSGMVLSVATRWGLLNHWWIVVKLVLTVVVILAGIVLFSPAVERAAAGAADSTRLVAAGGANVVMLLAATVLSIYKPWGRTRRGRRATGTKAGLPATR
jgi:hypothetical protein